MRRKDLMGYNMKVGVVVKSNLFGGLSLNGSWDGLVGQLLEGNVDIALALMALTSVRHAAVDFSLPLSISRELLLIQEPSEKEFAWDNFLRPFDCRVWLCAVAVIAGTWGVLRLQRSYRSALGNQDDFQQTYSDVLHVAGIFFMQGRGDGCDTRTRDSVRASLLVASMSALLVYTAYCGALTASLATHKLRMPFTDLQGLLTDGSYKLVLQDASGEMTIFRECTFVTNCCSRGMMCVVFGIDDACRSGILHLLQLRSEGVTHRLFRKHWAWPDDQETKESLNPVSINSVVPALAVLGAAALLSLCLLLLERKFWSRPVLKDAATSTDLSSGRNSNPSQSVDFSHI
ncbi:glutamate receptor 1-like [Schistocerca gregaria]|uniref:glutamate receptor 1-like n=1 Tax=Schistocerca gregaria TaxID=7010 RepID=UPI00211EE6D8|nr:glutamate receptor 1-like [Schistocerca gregaria]